MLPFWSTAGNYWGCWGGASFLVTLFRTRGDVIENSVPEYEYDAIGSNITEEELIKILEEMDYVMPDNITAQGECAFSCRGKLIAYCQ